MNKNKIDFIIILFLYFLNYKIKYSYGGSIEDEEVLDKRFNANDLSLYAFIA